MSEITVGKIEFEGLSKGEFENQMSATAQYVTKEEWGKPIEAITEAKSRLIAAERRIVEAKAILSEYSDAVKALAELVPVGFHFQDDEGVVYQLAEQDGKFVYFDRHTVKRTRREGETKGSLALKDAEALGYEVKK